MPEDKIWDADYLDTEKKFLRRPKAIQRELTDDEKFVVRMMEIPEWESMKRIAQNRATRAKARLYRENLSNQELETGKLLGSLETLEWLIRLPDTIAHIISARRKSNGIPNK